MDYPGGGKRGEVRQVMTNSGPDGMIPLRGTAGSVIIGMDGARDGRRF
jgi:hypothetical protein